MRVVVPYATLFPETQAALEADGRTADYRYVGGLPTDYHDLVAALWRDGQGFIIVEQDIVVYNGALAQLEECPEPWCGCVYWLGTTFDTWLGCTKFSDSLVKDHPEVMDVCAGLRENGMPRRDWARVDTRLAQVLRDNIGLSIHQHWPAVEHLNPDKLLRGAFNCVYCGDPLPWETVKRQPPPYPCEHNGPPLPSFPGRIMVSPTVKSEPAPTAIMNCAHCGSVMPCQQHG
jgi:hypothetical protein